MNKRRFYYILNYLLFLSNRFYCPCCKRGSRKFLPFGVKPRTNAQCPRCGSLERHRLLQLYLEEKTNFFKDKLKVLDIAPTSILQQKWKVLPNIDYVSADILSPLAMLKIDITDIPIRDNQFDCIFCYHVLEHVADDRKAMRELFRILKPSGWAIIQSPVDFNRDTTFEDPNIILPTERECFFGQKDHVRAYGKDYRERLEIAGFTVKVDNFVEGLGDLLIKKYGLMKEQKIYFCTKSR